MLAPSEKNVTDPEKLIGAVLKLYFNGPGCELKDRDAAHETLEWIANILAGYRPSLESAAALLMQQESQGV